jgi:hypothetical protein
MAYESLYMQFRRAVGPWGREAVGILLRLYPVSRTTSHIQFPSLDPAVWLRVINIHRHKNVISAVWFPIRFELIFPARAVTLSAADRTALCWRTEPIWDRRELTHALSQRKDEGSGGSSVRRLLVTASVFPSSSILVTLMKETLSSSETSVLTRTTRRNIPKTPFFIVTVVKISNLTEHLLAGLWSGDVMCLL